MPEITGSGAVSRAVSRAVSNARGAVYHPVFATAVLARIGAPPTPANVRSFRAWAKQEGGRAKWNPLNTTLHRKGASAYNTFGNGPADHVWDYASFFSGVDATATTLLQYPQLVKRFRSGKGLCGFFSTELAKWSGGGYSVIHC
jgi:hypothetical protein